MVRLNSSNGASGDRRSAARMPPVSRGSPTIDWLKTARSRDTSGPSSASRRARARIRSLSASRPSTSNRARPRSPRRVRSFWSAHFRELPITSLLPGLDGFRQARIIQPLPDFAGTDGPTVRMQRIDQYVVFVRHDDRRDFQQRGRP